MSGANAFRTIPPGDRDDPPSGSPPDAGAPTVAGREQPKDAGLELEIQRLDGALNEARYALDDFKLARAQGDLAGQEAPAWRMALTLKVRIDAIAQRLAHSVTERLVQERRRRSRQVSRGGFP